MIKSKEKIETTAVALNRGTTELATFWKGFIRSTFVNSKPSGVRPIRIIIEFYRSTCEIQWHTESSMHRFQNCRLENFVHTDMDVFINNNQSLSNCFAYHTIGTKCISKSERLEMLGIQAASPYAQTSLTFILKT